MTTDIQRLSDLAKLPLAKLLELDDPKLAVYVDRLNRHVDRPGASVAGYNGAGGNNSTPAK